MRRALTAMLWLAALAGLAHIVSSEVLGDATSRASDALPLYLSGAAFADGLDPTLAADLAQAYDARGMDVGAATFSTLYPATAGLLMQWAGGLSWEAFTTVWRWVLVLALATFGPSAAWLAERERALWGGLVAAALAWHPVSLECVRLGQVNMLLGALCAAAIAAAARGRGGFAGVALALGALLKLVPGALIVPLIAVRQRRPFLALAATGGIGLALTMVHVPLPRVLEAVGETVRFQGTIDPDWLVGRDPAPEWMRLLGFVRHAPLQWITLGMAAIVCAARPSRETATAAMALVCAWLGADAAGFHVLYTPLAFPALVAAGVGRPLQMGLLLVALYGLSFAGGLDPEPRMVLFGLVTWVVTAAVLLDAARRVAPAPFEADAELRTGGLALCGVAAGVLLAGAVPGEGPVAAPLPEGQTAPEGAGFIHPGDRVPGATRALGGGIDRPASTLAQAGTIRALQLHLRRAPTLWRGLAERYPARQSLMTARANAVPGGELRDLSGREVGAWLREEQAAVAQLDAEAFDVTELAESLRGALTSGLADPGLETRVPQ